jgi:hypothetical protein
MSDLRNTQEFTRGRWRIKGDSSWDSTAQVAAKRGEKEWTVEMAIPLSELGNPPTIGTWGLQAGREYGTKGDATRYRRFYAWAPTEGEFGKPENFGDLLFEDSPLAFTACEMSEPAVVGGNHVEFAVSSRDRKPHEVNVTAVVEMEDGKRRELKPLAVKIDAERGGAGELNVELDNPGRHVVTFLCEEKGKPPVLRLGTVVQTKPPLALSRDSIVLAEGRLSASISLAMGGVAMDRAIALSIVGPRWTMPLGRFQQISTLQKVDIGLAGLDAPPGNYLVRAEALKGDRIMARVEEPLFVDAPFME